MKTTTIVIGVVAAGLALIGPAMQNAQAFTDDEIRAMQQQLQQQGQQYLDQAKTQGQQQVQQGLQNLLGGTTKKGK